MKLVDLHPIWLTKDVFAFKSPINPNNWLTCKRFHMSYREQVDLIVQSKFHRRGANTITTKADAVWSFGNNFETLTVTPSLDFSASSDWHGFITNGEIVHV